MYHIFGCLPCPQTTVTPVYDPGNCHREGETSVTVRISEYIYIYKHKGQIKTGYKRALARWTN
jgi:hypothetical protein